ncbi:MAG: preprotein translocase subunit YajC [Candidatus Puniceispirillales bacterium]
MIISPAFAQAAGAGGPSMLGQLLPFILIFVVFYFLLIRPQQKRAKEHKNLVDSLKKGDQVITSGGLKGSVTKATDGNDSITVEIAKGVEVEVVRGMIAEVRDKDGNPMLPAKK